MTKREMLGVVIFVIIFALFCAYARDRFEKIDNGEIVVVSESYMDR